jgi:molybdopterin converting factor small subunit
VARLRLFGPAREAAGTACADVPGQDVAGIIAAAEARFGEGFARVMAVSNVWLNGDAVELHVRVSDDDEVAVIPPVSGG